MVHGTADTAVAVAMNVMDTGKDHFLEDEMIIEEDLILGIAETILETETVIELRTRETDLTQDLEDMESAMIAGIYPGKTNWARLH